MKKLFILTAVTFSALSFAYAQDAPAVRPTIVKPMITTGDTALDAQVKALRAEMEVKIKELRAEYEAKIKVILGDKKPMIVKPNGATTTMKEIRKEIKEERKEIRKEIKEERKEVRKEIKEERKGNMEERREMKVEGSATGNMQSPNTENKKPMERFRDFFVPKNQPNN